MACTIQQWLADTTCRLDKAHVSDARLKVELLLSEQWGIPRLALPTADSERLPRETVHSLEEQVLALSNGQPLQYVLGHTEFMGHHFLCDDRALIPRPETEGLVEHVWSHAGTLPHDAHLVDVGTGTGCIPISIILEGFQGKVSAVDLSPKALALAKENERHLIAEPRIHFIEDDLLAGFEPASVDVIVSNPPYISNSEYELLPNEVLFFEPASALLAGTLGTEFYERLLEEATLILKPQGRVFLEIGETQGVTVSALCRKFGFFEVVVSKDLAGRDRYVTGMKS